MCYPSEAIGLSRNISRWALHVAARLCGDTLHRLSCLGVLSRLPPSGSEMYYLRPLMPIEGTFSYIFRRSQSPSVSLLLFHFFLLNNLSVYPIFEKILSLIFQSAKINNFLEIFYSFLRFF